MLSVFNRALDDYATGTRHVRACQCYWAGQAQTCQRRRGRTGLDFLMLMGQDRPRLVNVHQTGQAQTCQCPRGKACLDQPMPLGPDSSRLINARWAEQAQTGQRPQGGAGLNLALPMGQGRPRLVNAHVAWQAYACQCPCGRQAQTGKCPWEKTGVDRTGLVNVWVAIKERDLFFQCSVL